MNTNRRIPPAEIRPILAMLPASEDDIDGASARVVLVTSKREIVLVSLASVFEDEPEAATVDADTVIAAGSDGFSGGELERWIVRRHGTFLGRPQWGVVRVGDARKRPPERFRRDTFLDLIDTPETVFACWAEERVRTRGGASWERVAPRGIEGAA